MRIEVHHFHHGAPETPTPCCCACSGEFKANVLTALSRLIESVGQVLTNQKEESRMSNATHALVTRLVGDVAAQGTVLASAETLLNGIPNVVREAVQEALDANPALTPEDLVAVTQAADSIEAQTTELAAAVTANTPAAPATGGGETPPETAPPADTQPATE